MLKSAKDVLASGELASIVDFAIEANRLLTTTSKDLGLVKAHLRRLAEDRRAASPELTSVRLEGYLGVAHIVMATKPIFRTRRGMVLMDLKNVLPEDTFRTLFEERVVVDIGMNYAENFSDLSPSQRLVVEKFVEKVPQTARVNLPE